MGVIWLAGAALWGIAEASFFFVVPDVLITFVVMRFGLRQGLSLCVAAALFAAVTGYFMWLWGAHDATAARRAMLMVPAIGPDLLARAHDEIVAGLPVKLVAGAMTGVPYKLYAVEAGARGIDPFLFLPMSFAARLLRFVLTAIAAAVGREAVTCLGKPDWRYAIWGLAWLAIYGFYWTTRGLI
jgi:membrane protein YqaA with SNARE-associated domain